MPNRRPKDPDAVKAKPTSKSGWPNWVLDHDPESKPEELTRGQLMRFYPNLSQKKTCHLGFNLKTCVYNQAHDMKEAAYEKGEKLGFLTISKQWSKDKKKPEFEKYINLPASIAQHAMRNLETAYSRFFNEIAKKSAIKLQNPWLKGKPVPKPKKKGKYSKQSFTLSMDHRNKSEEAAWKRGELMLPGLGICRIRGARRIGGKPKLTKEKIPRGKDTRPFEGSMPKSMTVSFDSAGRYWISFNQKFTPERMETLPFVRESIAAGDVGSKNFCTFDDGTVIENPKFYQSKLPETRKRHRAYAKKLKDGKKLTREQKKLAAKETKTSGRAKRKRKYNAKREAKIAFQRKDWLHKESHKLIVETQVFCRENVSVAEMMKRKNNSGYVGKTGKSHRQIKSATESAKNSSTNSKSKTASINLPAVPQPYQINYGRALADVGIGMFNNFTEYKSKWYGRSVLKCGRWEPSTQTCSKCEKVSSKKITIDIREWVCEYCQTKHDRDINAAKNILHFAVGKTALSLFEKTDSKQHVERLNEGLRSQWAGFLYACTAAGSLKLPRPGQDE